MKRLAALSLLVFAASANADCFQVYKGNSIIFQADFPPVDISFVPGHGPSPDLIGMRQRGEQLVFLTEKCTRTIKHPRFASAPPPPPEQETNTFLR